MKTRPTRILPEWFDRRLNFYALAASAAGVSVLALVRPADAKIIYTPIHRVIATNTSFRIDVNHDGVFDFTISNSSWGFGKALLNSIHLWPNLAESAKVEASFRSRSWRTFFAVALKKGTPIPNSQRFYSRGEMVARCAHGTTNTGSPCWSHPYNTLGNWINVKDRYLGLAFTIHDGIHYGWARLNVALAHDLGSNRVVATLTGYAYETVPGKSIIAGQTRGADDIGSLEPPDRVTPIPIRAPATLGTLALGAPGLSIWRREESVASAPAKH